MARINFGRNTKMKMPNTYCMVCKDLDFWDFVREYQAKSSKRERAEVVIDMAIYYDVKATTVRNWLVRSGYYIPVTC